MKPPPKHLLELAAVVKRHAAEAQGRRVVSARERTAQPPQRKPVVAFFSKRGAR